MLQRALRALDASKGPRARHTSEGLHALDTSEGPLLNALEGLSTPDAKEGPHAPDTSERPLRPEYFGGRVVSRILQRALCASLSQVRLGTTAKYPHY